MAQTGDLLSYGMAKSPIQRTQRRPFFKQWRKYRRMTLEKAGELADMTAGNISAMERNTQGYTQAGLEALAKAYRCQPGDLLMVDPSRDEEAFWPIWEAADAENRRKIVDIARTIVGKPER